MMLFFSLPANQIKFVGKPYPDRSLLVVGLFVVVMPTIIQVGNRHSVERAYRGEMIPDDMCRTPLVGMAQSRGFGAGLPVMMLAMLGMSVDLPQIMAGFDLTGMYDGGRGSCRRG
jgi:hypothetical protein